MPTCITSGTHVSVDKLYGLFPHHVARAEALIKLGLSASTVYRRCQPAGPWRRVLPGVVMFGKSPPTVSQRVQAALCYADPDGLVTGHHALVLHGMKIPPPPPLSAVHVLVPKGRSLKSTPEVSVERTIRMPKAMMRKGYLVAPLERALLDTVRGFGNTEQVRSLLAEAIWEHGLPPKLITAELDAGNSRGSALPRRVLAEVVNGIRTEAEALAATLVGAARLPRPQWSMQVDDENNAYLGPVSAWWDDVAMALDIDVSEHPFERTEDQHDNFLAASVVVVRTTPRQMRASPRAFVDRLRQAYQRASKRDRPLVTATAQHPRS